MAGPDKMSSQFWYADKCESSFKYIPWLQIVDQNAGAICNSETMVRLISHATFLKVDDVGLKVQLLSTRYCGLCDVAAKDYLRHLILQCPRWQMEKEAMFKKQASMHGWSSQNLLKAQGDCVQFCWERGQMVFPQTR